jgi:hypothetical protein
MRKMVLVILLLGWAGPATAAKRVTADEMEQAISAAHALTDAKAAERIYELELTERLSSARLAHDEAELPGPASRQAIHAVADASAFLDLPAADLPPNPAPDRDRQSAMWEATLECAQKTISRLPNFFATRETIRFEDAPSEPPRNTTDTIRYQPLHPVGSEIVTVLYRNGHEFVDAGVKLHKSFDPSDFELSASGEFGPILATVLADSARNGVIWSHWEQGAAGLMAVFRYTVARESSHYTVTFPGPERDLQLLSAYHGEIAIDPADGSILRLTMVADLKSEDPVTAAGLLVEYGPVEIAGSNYICPVKSVALSLVPKVRVESSSTNGRNTSRGPLQIRVNDVAFRDYHLFRAEVRIVGDDAGEPNRNQPGAAPASAPSAGPNR